MPLSRAIPKRLEKVFSTLTVLGVSFKLITLLKSWLGFDLPISQFDLKTS